MAKLSDIKYAREGEQKVDPVVPEMTRQEIITAGPVKESGVKRGYVIFKLVDNTKKGRVWIDGIDDVVNPKTQEVERIRLLRGVSSIWMKDQEKLTAEYVSRNRMSLRFEDRVLRLETVIDKTAIEFARHTRHFIENPHMKTGSKLEFFEWNPARQEELALAKEMLEIEVVQLAVQQSPEKMRKHAAFLGGVPFTDELGELRTDEGIRVYYVRAAKRDPERFKKTLGSREVEISYLVRRVILDAKIDLGGESGSVSWAKGGAICRVPKGRNATDYLIEYALLPNEEGKLFLEQLQENVK
jgi:hypothetical protein